MYRALSAALLLTAPVLALLSETAPHPAAILAFACACPVLAARVFR